MPIPGPGVYDPSYNQAETKLSYSFYGPKSPENFSKTHKSMPGPGSYDSRPMKNPGVKFGTSLRRSWKEPGSPGPGAYSHERRSSAGPGFAFGSGQRS